MGNPRYTVICKVGVDDFKKWRAVTNLIRFTEFLDTTYPSWRFYNVFDSKTKEQIASYTQKRKPQTRFVS